RGLAERRTPWCTAEASLGSGRRADSPLDRGQPTAGRDRGDRGKRAAALRRVAGAGHGGLRAGRRGALERRGCGRGWMTRRPRKEGTQVTRPVRNQEAPVPAPRLA